jgi:hypothetical protein
LIDGATRWRALAVCDRLAGLAEIFVMWITSHGAMHHHLFDITEGKAMATMTASSNSTHSWRQAGFVFFGGLMVWGAVLGLMV